MPEFMLVVAEELLDLLDSMELMETQLALVSLDHLDHLWVKVPMGVMEPVVHLVNLVVTDNLAILVVKVVTEHLVAVAAMVNLVNLDRLVKRENHSDRDNRNREEIVKEIEEREGKSIEVGQNHAVVLDSSGKVISQYHTSSKDRMVREESTALVVLAVLVVLAAVAAAAVKAALAELVVLVVTLALVVDMAAAVKVV